MRCVCERYYCSTSKIELSFSVSVNAQLFGVNAGVLRGPKLSFSLSSRMVASSRQKSVSQVGDLAGFPLVVPSPSYHANVCLFRHQTHAFSLQEEVDVWISGARGGEVWHKGVPPGCMSFDAGGGRATAVDDNEVADHSIEDVQASGCVPDGRGVSSPRTVQCNRRHRRRGRALGTGGDDTLDKLVRAVVASPREGEDEEISPTPSPRYLKAGVVPNSSEWINVRTGLVTGTSTTTELNYTPSDDGRRRRDTRFSIGAGEDGSVLSEQCEHCQGDRVPITEARKERLANQGHHYVEVKTCCPGMRASTSGETMAPVSGEEICQSTVHRHHRHRHRILSSEPDTAEMLRETVLDFWEPKDAAAATASPLAVAVDATAGGLFEHVKITTTTGLEGRGWFWGAPAWLAKHGN